MFQRNNIFVSQIGKFFILPKRNKQTHLTESNKDFVAELSLSGMGTGTCWSHSFLAFFFNRVKFIEIYTR